ncbi:hypothetical protein NHX12_005690 [Muraenolepis orangiensis]|uniref:Uncharacterized protein n=1 Tax=Muraenolepis orangiensis TaxID=630683 RepID=A0A9Q0DR44_9TELE|nr:hypothetical protein NHX12_005690 [Muraenolepis orangiensis]
MRGHGAYERTLEEDICSEPEHTENETTEDRLFHCDALLPSSQNDARSATNHNPIKDMEQSWAPQPTVKHDLGFSRSPENRSHRAAVLVP